MNQRVGIIGHLLGQSVGNFAYNCMRMERLGSAKLPNQGPKRCPMIPTLVKKDPEA